MAEQEQQTQKSIQRTYEIDPEGTYFVRTPQVMAGLKKRLANDAKKSKLELDGELVVIKQVQIIGRSVTITVSAPVKG